MKNHHFANKPLILLARPVSDSSAEPIHSQKINGMSPPRKLIILVSEAEYKGNNTKKKTQ